MYENYKTRYHLGWNLNGIPELMGICVMHNQIRMVTKIAEVSKTEKSKQIKSMKPKHDI